ncbi:zinc finger protein 862-like [Mytilus edulis]|uniref:zinc finger protein 862-like n=1 Tax=Mytilus edulis TaxID=6550 RepID=UPI0039EED84A
MPSTNRMKRKREEENEKQAAKCRKLLSFFQSTKEANVCGTTHEHDESVHELVETEMQTQRETLPVIATPTRERHNSGHSSNFNKKWKEGRPWLKCDEEITHDGISFESMYCIICIKWNTKSLNGSTIWNKEGCQSFRLDKIKSHETSCMHKQAISMEIKDQTTVTDTLSHQNDKEFAALEDAQKVLYFLISHSLPHTTLFKPLVELCVELGAKNLPYLNKGQNASYTGHSIVNEFLSCQAEVVENKVKNEINTSQSYGVMIDEYTDISGRKHLALVGKYIHLGSSRLSFLQDIQIPNGTADTIYSSIKSYLNDKAGLKLHKLTSFASDGPTVMLGKKNGVATQLKRENESVVTVHCMNHRLQLAVSKTFTTFRKIEKTDELLKGLFKYYHYSTVKSGSLDALQTLLREMNELETVNNLVVTKATSEESISYYGDSDISFLAEHFKLNEEEALLEWNEIKQIFKEEREKCSARYMLSTLSKKSPMLGDTFPNINFLLSGGFANDNLFNQCNNIFIYMT